MSNESGGNAGIRDQWVVLPQGRLFVRRWSPGSVSGRAGGAAPIILFHDSLGCVELWRTFPARLSQATGRVVYAYDRLGFGRSDPHPGRLHDDFIEDEAATAVAAIRRQLDIAEFVAFGHSVGGGMALHCAATIAADCRAVITESAQAFVEDRTTHGIRAAKEGFRQPGQMGRLEKYHGDKAQWVLDAWTETWLSAAFASWSLKDLLPRVNVPLLVIHGGEDEYGSPRQPEMIARCAAGPTRMEVLDGVHHVPHREDEKRIVQLVCDFLAGLDGS